ncbi:spermidine/putrescine ABC transporter ATP-binding protein [Skermanella stibiiresistens SB22]|uniref:Spermidine/putrescine ABC transporter ATP-binding protein n=1 Tax=Skermanella stibiiresistens SB22 TaxID=1385369 RepID=W9GZF3_9PROT|nr:ABC transporter ATP-binding protein [Skermanella stibiiresistens]EWY39310.1 spermidine/putrescine ABC transporter ATP-binding protein [Skermanella stibiiresistens SB22]
MAGLVLDGVTKLFGRTAAVDAVDLSVADGEFLAVLGPSGCGKTTLLRLIAGFERIDGGSISLGGRVVSDSAKRLHVVAEERRVGIVFQSYALWPHMTVAGNVGYPLSVAGVKGQAHDDRVGAALDLVGLSGFGTRRPAELSGGQRQRVALARCLVMEPSLVLLDEPLANLDVHLRASMEDEFAAFHAKTRATMVYITHDQAEAMALADRIAVMDGGRIVQVAPPRVLYAEPATAMVAGFIGKGAVVEATVLERLDQGRAVARIGGVTARLRCSATTGLGPALACLRPEDLTPGADGLPTIVRRATYKGGVTALDLVPEGMPGVTLPLMVGDGRVPEPGQRLTLAIGDGWIIPAGR